MLHSFVHSFTWATRMEKCPASVPSWESMLLSVMSLEAVESWWGWRDSEGEGWGWKGSGGEGWGWVLVCLCVCPAAGGYTYIVSSIVAMQPTPLQFPLL